MSVSRDIEIRLLSNDRLSILIQKLSENFWHFKSGENTYVSIPLNDDGDYDFQTFVNVYEVYNILDKRAAEKKVNSIFFNDVIHDESFVINIESLENSYKARYHYRFSFSPGIGKRIEGVPRLTDYGFYLNQLLPKFISMNCDICEVTCHDFDF